MKTNTITMFLALGTACVGVAALTAQSTDLTAKVPFVFQVGGQSFAAGDYLVGQAGGYGHVGVPFLRNATTGQSVFIAGADHSLTQAANPKLVFHCYTGKTCFLAEIRPPHEDGSHVSMSKAEREIAQADQPAEVATISIDVRHAD